MNRRLVPIFVAIGIFLTGCRSTPDLAMVQKYAETTAAAAGSFDAVAADYGQTCVRANEYEMAPREMPFVAFTLAPGYAVAGSPPDQTPANMLQTCAGAIAIGADWSRHNAVVLGYVQALGAIASVDNAPSFQPLGNALVAPGLLSQPQSDAFSSLANHIANFFIVQTQQRDIAALVVQVDPDLKTAIDSLKIVASNYSVKLSTEYDVTFGFYNGLIRSEIGSRPPAQGKLPLKLKERILRQRAAMIAALRAINAKRAASIAYAKALDSIYATHEQLKNSSEHPSTDDLVKAVEQNLATFAGDIATIQQAVR